MNYLHTIALVLAVTVGAVTSAAANEVDSELRKMADNSPGLVKCPGMLVGM